MNTTRLLIAAGLVLAVAAVAPAATADPIVVDPGSLLPTVRGCDPVLGCYTIQPESFVPTIRGCDPVLGCYTIGPGPVVVDVDPDCSVSADGDGIHVECY